MPISLTQAMQALVKHHQLKDIFRSMLRNGRQDSAHS
jgi:hypothetical protein